MKTISATYTYTGPTQRGLEHNRAYALHLHFGAGQVNVEVREAPYVVYTYNKFVEFIRHWDGIRLSEGN